MRALADAANQIPDRPARLRVEAGRQLVEKHHLGVVDERQRDEQPLLLPAGERHEPGVPLLGEPELREKPLAFRCGPAVEREPQIDGFPHLDPLLQLRLLQLDADALLQRIHVAKRIEAEHGDGAIIGLAQPLDAFHRRRLARAIRSDEAEDLALVDLERHLVHGGDSVV